MKDLLSLALDARATWAMFRVELIAAGTGSDAAIALMERASWAAELVGSGAYPHDPMPALLADVPQLAQAWRNGYAIEDEWARQASFCFEQKLEMSRCRGCNNGTGNPCSTHG